MLPDPPRPTRPKLLAEPLAQLRGRIGGIGIALLPSGLVRGPLNRGELILVSPEYFAGSVPFAVIDQVKA